MDVFANAVTVGRFFVTSDPPPANVFMMCVQPDALENLGTCICIHDGAYWSIAGNRMVRLLDPDEYDQTVFHG